MRLSLSDQMISEFLSGLIAVFVLLAVGCVLALILQKVIKNHTFTRLALILALTPLSLIKFMDRSGSSTLYVYAMIVILLGITIDGINFLLTPKENQDAAPAEKKPATKERAATETEVIVWEKAE